MHYCDYKTITDSKEGKVELCLVCKKRLVTKKDSKTGRIDNKKYLKAHQADYAQPYGRTSKIFGKVYGEAPKDLRYK